MKSKIEEISELYRLIDKFNPREKKLLRRYAAPIVQLLEISIESGQITEDIPSYFFKDILSRFLEKNVQVEDAEQNALELFDHVKTIDDYDKLNDKCYLLLWALSIKLKNPGRLTKFK